MFFEYLIIIVLFILVIALTKKKLIKYFFIGVIYLLVIVYSLELLTTLFLENKHLSNHTLRTDKFKSLGFKDFRNNYEAFQEERQKFDIVAEEVAVELYKLLAIWEHERRERSR